MTLTITEKNHWKERIEAKIENKIKRLEATDPDLFNKTKERSRNQLLKDLTLTSEYDKLVSLDERINTLEEELAEIAEKLYIAIKGEPIYYGRYNLDTVNREIESKTKLFEEDYLSESKLGSEIVRLRSEKENLLDTIWLATTNRQIKELWTQTTDLLGEQPTLLQKQAIETAPIE
ncbi:MAG: hypothetical protein P1V20_22625 [Verrucomicrobiales bacterium]|nr:hypothetical protein [Verrucomicrobiales bacterium]